MRLVTVIDKIERILISALFAVMVLAVFSQVVNRNIFKLEIGWFEEVARACMVYIILFAAEIGLRDHSQLNIDSLVRLPAALRSQVCCRMFLPLLLLFFPAWWGLLLSGSFRPRLLPNRPHPVWVCPLGCLRHPSRWGVC